MNAGVFRPHPLLRGPHAQTIYPFCIRSRRPPPWQRERLELPDGDFLDLCHLGPSNAPTVCLLHGLEGCASSHYIGGLATALTTCHYRVTFMHFRGCSGEPNRAVRTYHSGDTGDIAFLFETLARRQPDSPLMAVGFSLGGNALLKYLGECAETALLSAAAAVSPPFRLAVATRRIDQGLSRLYHRYLMQRMKASIRARAKSIGDLPIDMQRMQRARTLREFDDHVTAPLHGFRDADDYYARSSAAFWLARIETPTLVLHARDDPFLGPAGVPDACAAGPGVTLEISERGGHVGFIASDCRGMPVRWLEQRIPQWLSTAR